MMRLFLLFFLISISSITIYGQEEGIEIPSDPVLRGGRTARLYGKVLDANNKGIGSATVEVFSKKVNAAGDAGYDSLIAGMLTKTNGDFSFENFKIPDSFAVVFSNLGYANKMEVVKVPKRGPGAFMSPYDMGNIKLETAPTSLQEIKVTGTKPALEMSIDRKIFSVDKSITSTGGTAIDVMRNIPSVTVDVNGEVQLRNASPQIFVDGRPTILTLQQIPADDIDRIELITNPSAKFDAATTGGIINVVLKKSRRAGLNGVATIGGGYPEVLTGNLSLNMRQGKFNFFCKWKL